jgi:arylamine N-acetyltransferase
VHCVNIVILDDGTRWMTDVGYGGDGPISPLPMLDGVSAANIGTQEVRLAFEPLDGQVDPNQRMWIYQLRQSPDANFTSCYAFMDKEFIHQDFEVMNFFTSKHPSSYMTNTVAMVKFMHRGYDDVYAKLILLNDEVRENSGGTSTTLFKCKTETDRTQALEEHFGIKLSDEEKTAILDTALALPAA